MRALCRKYGGLRRWNSMVGQLIRKKSGAVDSATPVSELREDTELDKAAFSEILGKIDQGLRALPATAQVRTAHRHAHGTIFEASLHLLAPQEQDSEHLQVDRRERESSASASGLGVWRTDTELCLEACRFWHEGVTPFRG